MTIKVHAVDRPELTPLEMRDHFKTEIVYFMTPTGEHGAPDLAAGEYWIRREDAQQWLEDFVVSVISPLDAASRAEFELTDEQEAWLEWMVANDVQRVRLEKS